jgi:hypothetical protein
MFAGSSISACDLGQQHQRLSIATSPCRQAMSWDQPYNPFPLSDSPEAFLSDEKPYLRKHVTPPFRSSRNEELMRYAVTDDL